MKIIYFIFFFFLFIAGCKENAVQPEPEKDKLIFNIEKEEYIYDSKWEAYIINNSNSNLYFPCCWQPFYGIEQLINNRWFEYEEVRGGCPPTLREIKELIKFDTLVIYGRAQSPGTYRFKTIYGFDSQNFFTDTVYSNIFIVKENPVLTPPEDQKVLIRMEKDFYLTGALWTAWVKNETDSNLFYAGCNNIMVAVEKLQAGNWVIIDDGAQVCDGFISPYIEVSSKFKVLIEDTIYVSYTPGIYRLKIYYWNHHPLDNPGTNPEETRHQAYSNTFEIK